MQTKMQNLRACKHKHLGVLGKPIRRMHAVAWAVLLGALLGSCEAHDINYNGESTHVLRLELLCKVTPTPTLIWIGTPGTRQFCLPISFALSVYLQQQLDCWCLWSPGQIMWTSSGCRWVRLFVLVRLSVCVSGVPHDVAAKWALYAFRVCLSVLFFYQT